MRLWSIHFLNENGNEVIELFEEKSSLDKCIKSLPTKTLLLAKVYDPDNRMIEGKTYIQMYLLNASEVAKRYPKSFIGARWIATILDLIVCAFIIFSIPHFIENKALQNWITFGLILSYYMVLEGLTGYTVGKFIIRIRVVNSNFKNPGLVKALIRTLLRIIEVNPILLGGIPAAISALLTKDKKRIGDVLANTYVLYAKDISKNRG